MESALVSHPSVAEAAVVGANDATTGQAIIAYVTLRGGLEVDEKVLRDHVAREIGAIAKPKTIYFTPDLPKMSTAAFVRAAVLPSLLIAVAMASNWSAGSLFSNS